MIGPILSKEYTNVLGGKVIFKDYTQIGANTIVMPNVILNEGAVTGTFTFVKKDLEEWCIYAGIPAKKIKCRSRNVLKLSEKMRENKNER